MMEETIDNVGAVPREVSADAGYYSAKAVDELYPESTEGRPWGPLKKAEGAPLNLG